MFPGSEASEQSPDPEQPEDPEDLQLRKRQAGEQVGPAELAEHIVGA